VNATNTKTILAAVILSTAAFAGSPVDPVNKSWRGIAVKGYDPVAYFTESRPVKGSADFAYQWMGATWWFANSGNRDLFQATPDKYAPQFGGYCAWAVSKGYTADTDPEAWKIIDGKLYLNYNKDVQKKWEVDVSQRIVDAIRNWPSLHK
jgi:YHS domain-containing protein